MVRAVAIACMAVAAAIVVGCGATEKSGTVGDKLTAKGLDVTVSDVDTSVPVDRGDVTGLSQPSPGSKLVGVRVRVCSDHRGAIGPWDFGVVTAEGDQGALKFPERNYAKEFTSQRQGCGGGWIVFEIPSGTKPEEATFGFEDTGTAREYQNIVEAKFAWTAT